VNAVDAGDVTSLQNLINQYPRLVQQPLDRPSGDYFNNPCLLYFIADNPVRVPALPGNILQVTALLADKVNALASATAQQQLNYTLALAASGRVPRECGVQLQMIDILIEKGAKPGTGWEALAHGNIDAAKRLAAHGGRLTLPAAVVIEDNKSLHRLFDAATGEEKLVAVQAAAFYGNAAMLQWLVKAGAPFNDYAPDNSGFHTHSAPLHQAVLSGSLEAVKILVEAGARLDMTDKAYGGTPLGWAMYAQNEESSNNETRAKYKAIEVYLRIAMGNK
jgi:peptide-methionine (S)-S-oxide reductase